MANAMSEENAVRAANEVFYQALSAGSIEGISASCAHDSDVTALHETSPRLFGSIWTVRQAVANWPLLRIPAGWNRR
jgi:hypothetical protein